MKKLFTFFLGLVLSAALLPAQEYWNQYLINENFDGAIALPEGWAYQSASSSSTTAVFGRSGSISYVDGIRISGGGSGNRGGEIKFPLAPDSSTVYLDVDLRVVKSTVNYRNTFQFYLLGSKSVNLWSSGTPYADVIGGIYWAGGSGKFHVWNKDVKGPSPLDSTTMQPNNDTVPVFTTGQYPAFRRAGTSTHNTDSMNLSTVTEVGRLYNVWYTLSFKLDFAKRKMDVTITQKDSVENSQTITGLDFVSPTVSDLAIVGMVNNRASNQGNASNADLDATLDNFKVYQKVLSLGREDVTIKYQDETGKELKASRIDPQQEVSLNYTLWDEDKMSFTKDGIYYSYDPVATGSESVTVATGGSTIIVKFKGAPVTAGPYIWKGTVSEFFNEQDANFTTDGTNQLAYQIGNTVQFSDPEAPIKEVTMDKLIDMGDGNLVINAPGYTINGTTGALKGTGDIEVNASTRLNFINLMEGGVNLNKDTLYLANMQVTDSIFAKAGTVLNVRTGGFNKPVVGTGGEFTLIPGATAEYTGRITGFDQVNYVLQVKGNLSGYTYSGMPRLNNYVENAIINVTTALADTTFFGTTINQPDNKIILNENVYLAHTANPGSSGDPNVHVTLGALSGVAKTGLLGAALRNTHYHVGALNTDEVFGGEFFLQGTDPTTHLYKEGKGSWTLTGNSPAFKGNLRVNDGLLIVDGSIGSGQIIPTVIVADTAALAGKGFIGSLLTTVNGTLKGSLHFGGSLTLAPVDPSTTYTATTEINVDGSNIDKVVIDGDLTYGGTLKVNVTGALPPVGDYQIFQAGAYIEVGEFGFDTIQLPSENWTFDFLSGTLSYKGGDTSVSSIDFNKEIESMEYFDLTGKKVTGKYEGFIITKVKYTDGTSGAYKSFKKFNN